MRADQIKSELVATDLDRLVARYHLPEACNATLPGPEERMSHPPPGKIAINEGILQAGFRFLPSDLVVQVLRGLRVAPTQLVPNSWRALTVFQVLCRMHEIPATLNVFWEFYSLSGHPQDKGWWCFAARRGCGLVKEAPTSIHKWKERFFFVDADPSWEIRATWETPMKSPIGLSRLSREESDGLAALKGLVAEGQLPPVARLISEDTLGNVGLSSVPTDRESATDSFLTFSLLSSRSFLWFLRLRLSRPFCRDRRRHAVGEDKGCW